MEPHVIQYTIDEYKLQSAHIFTEFSYIQTLLSIDKLIVVYSGKSNEIMIMGVDEFKGRRWHFCKADMEEIIEICESFDSMDLNKALKLDCFKELMYAMLSLIEFPNNIS